MSCCSPRHSRVRLIVGILGTAGRRVMAAQGRTLGEIIAGIICELTGRLDQPFHPPSASGDQPRRIVIRVEPNSPPQVIQSPAAVRPRPRSKTRKKSSGIRFKPLLDETRTGEGPAPGLRDAFTGELLGPGRGLFQCSKCHVYYQRASLEVLKSENGGRCVSCLGTKIPAVKAQAARPAGQNYQAQVVTLENYKQHVGHVITFEGYVPRVNPSRDGRSFAVMFQDTSWNHGLKMVVFPGKVRELGGSRFLMGLRGKTLRVRGLLTVHPTFGYQIIVSEKNMVLGVR
jgi:hypothetical protein